MGDFHICLPGVRRGSGLADLPEPPPWGHRGGRGGRGLGGLRGEPSHGHCKQRRWALQVRRSSGHTANGSSDTSLAQVWCHGGACPKFRPLHRGIRNRWLPAVWWSKLAPEFVDLRPFCGQSSHPESLASCRLVVIPRLESRRKEVRPIRFSCGLMSLGLRAKAIVSVRLPRATSICRRGVVAKC